jgi:hypothetical protein
MTPEWKRKGRVVAAVAAVCAAALAAQVKLEYAKDGSGIFGYRDTPVQAWSGYRVHDPDRPNPKRIDPGEFSSEAKPGRPPSDAVVLFGGRDLAKWKSNQWKIEGGELVAGEGNLDTADDYGSFQLHLEWRVPAEETPNIMDRGNNGVFIMGLFEVQIFDSFRTKIYPDGQAASIYGQTPARVNAQRQPPAWEIYDILFQAPEFTGPKLSRPPFVTVLHNGVAVHHHQEIYGGTVHRSLPLAIPAGMTRGPLRLSGHHCPVRFRNIWLRPM